MHKILTTFLSTALLLSCASMDEKVFSELSNVYYFDYTGSKADHWDYEYSRVVTEAEFLEIVSSYDGIEFSTPMILSKGDYDFKNIPVRYRGEGGCEAHKGIKKSSTVFLILRDGVTIRNLNVLRSAQDGIEILGRVTLIDSKVMSSCDEAVTLRENSELTVLGGSYYSAENKAFIMKPYSRLELNNTLIVAEQGIAPCGTNNMVQVNSSKFRKHNRSEYATVFTGDDCINVNVEWNSGNTLGPGVSFSSIDASEDISFIGR